MLLELFLKKMFIELYIIQEMLAISKQIYDGCDKELYGFVQLIKYWWPYLVSINKIWRIICHLEDESFFSSYNNPWRTLQEILQQENIIQE